jgi:Bacterial toxin 50
LSQQEKHIPGCKNFQPGKGELTISVERLEKLVTPKLGEGVPTRFSFTEAGYKEVVDFEEIIGVHVVEKTGERIPTAIGEIHYAKDGQYHIVPVSPDKLIRIQVKRPWIIMNDEDIELLTSLKLSINRALWGAVIPSLRKVSLKWEPGDETAYILFYHDGEINDAIEENYSCIHTEVQADFVFDPKIDFEVMRCDYPERLPQVNYTIYARKEPFVDPH